VSPDDELLSAFLFATHSPVRFQASALGRAVRTSADWRVRSSTPPHVRLRAGVRAKPL